MKDKKITLEIEQLEERIAPGIAPGLIFAQGFTDAADGSGNLTNPGQGDIAGSVGFGQSSQGFC